MLLFLYREDLNKEGQDHSDLGLYTEITFAMIAKSLAAFERATTVVYIPPEAKKMVVIKSGYDTPTGKVIDCTNFDFTRLIKEQAKNK